MRWLLNGYTNTRDPLASYLQEEDIIKIGLRTYTGEADGFSLDSFVGGSDRYDPAEHGWVVVVSDDDEGRKIAAQLQPLIEHRLRIRNDDPDFEPTKPADAVKFFPADAAKDPAKLEQFISNNLRGRELGATPPFYVLVAGSPAKIPFTLEQQIASSEQCAGRLSFSSIESYGAYAQKVKDWEPDDDFASTVKKDFPVACFATDHGLGDATYASMKYMVEPFVAAFKKQKSRPAVVTKLRGQATAGALGSLIRGDKNEFAGPRLLFSATHGWAVAGKSSDSMQQRLTRQGAILCQNGVHLGEEELFDAAALGAGPALAGGIWVMFACFGAGTPEGSLYARALVDQPGLLGCHYGGPFVAALPTKLLENKDGPLAIVGHVDPVFTHAFSDPRGERGGRSFALFQTLTGLLLGKRVGMATSWLAGEANVFSNVLLDIDSAVARTLGKGLRDADAVQVATALAAAKPGDPLYKSKQDLIDYTVSRLDFRDFIILGDPAVKLPKKGATRAGAKPPSISVPSSPPEPQDFANPANDLPPALVEAAKDGRLVLPTGEAIFSEAGVEIPDKDAVVVALVASTCEDVRLRPTENNSEEGDGNEPAPFYEAAEHMACDILAPIRLSATDVRKAADFRFDLANGVSLRYGEALAIFGDFYGIVGVEVASGVDAFLKVFATFDRGNKDEMVNILNLVADERREVTRPGEQSSAGYERVGLSFIEKYNVATGGGGMFTKVLPKGRFLQLASVNFDHFGQNAIKAYCAGHEAALRQAIAARGQASEADQRKQLLRAYLMNACADHFLTDVFASGHLRVPRKAIIDQVTGFDIALLLVKCMHDEDNRYGLNVTNRRGDRWKTYGDGRFLDKENELGRQLAREAVMLSATEVWTAFETGQIPQCQVLDVLPDVEQAITSTDNHSPMFIVDGGVLKVRDNVKDRNCRKWTKYFVGAITAIRAWQG